jgi:curved DNA-binding protein CbpA
MSNNYYHVLGISMKASEAEIKSAYKKLALQYHPDKNNGSKDHEEIFKKIAEAYTVLSDKQKRAAYDLRLVYGVFDNYTTARRPATTTRPASATGTRRTYVRRTADPLTDLKAKSAAIAFTIFALVFWYYVKIFMDRYTAADHVKQGNYKTALEFDSENAEAYFMRGEIAMHKYQNFQSALSDYNLAIKFAETEKPEIYYARALCLVQLDRYEEALKDFKKTVALQPANDTAQFFVGNLEAFAFNNYKEGIKAFDQTLSVRPDFYEAMFGKGYCNLQLANTSNALEIFNEALKMYSLDPDLFYYRGFAFLAEKDTVAACKDWNEALIMGKIESKNAMQTYCPE